MKDHISEIDDKKAMLIHMADLSKRIKTLQDTNLIYLQTIEKMSTEIGYLRKELSQWPSNNPPGACL